MKTLYLDIFSGISGDMFIGALIDLGVDPNRLQTELEKLHLEGYHLHVARAQKSQISGIKFDVHLSHDHDHKPSHDVHEHDHSHSHSHAHGHSHQHEHEHHAHDEHGHDHEHHHDHEHGRNFAEIKELILHSALSDWVKEKSVNVFQRIAVAEGKIHGLPPEEVHFHEVGAVDSIIDIIGGCVALELLGKPRILAAPVVEGLGWINCAHGRFPIPAPATLEILGARGIAITQCDEPHELVTPTGAALLAEFVVTFGPMQGLVARKIGFGLGTRDNKTPAERPARNSGRNHRRSRRVIRERLADRHHRRPRNQPGRYKTPKFSAGFVELRPLGHRHGTFHMPIQMAKNRLMQALLTVLCAVAETDKFTELMLRETSAFGVRRSVAERRKLQREFVTVKTPYGEVTVKLGKLNGKILQATPEYESCKKLAESAKMPLKATQSRPKKH